MKPEEFAAVFEAVKVIPLRPSDILVFRTKARISAAKVEEVEELLQARLGHTRARILVLDGSVDLDVIRSDRTLWAWLKDCFSG